MQYVYKIQETRKPVNNYKMPLTSFRMRQQLPNSGKQFNNLQPEEVDEAEEEEEVAVGVVEEDYSEPEQ